ncbi:patatin-like phospholipase family protein [Cyclobacterium salsum]|uniref:patatin-like phospholipase family protein n=1 Tax=Cyclobacterium salsum TaxID=2666329 RepID=UPI0013908E71|nr:patatin-like phospholipase family protein [Cyclobacterium salsum]
MLIQEIHTDTDVNRSLILAGGGVRVAYQVGVMKALEEEGLEFNHVDGTSGGIFNAAMLACGQQVDDLRTNWIHLNLAHFVSPVRFRDYFTPWKLKGMGDTDAIRTKVLPHFKVRINSIREKGLPITFSLCNFSKKVVQAIPSKDLHENHLLAGISLPIVMPALQVAGEWFIDAVWIKDAHLMEAVRRGAEEIWVVWGIGNHPAYFSGALNQYVHSIEMSANGALWEEFEQIKWINKGIQRGESEFGQQRPIEVHLIHPSLPLPLDPDLFFNKITSRDLINMGYQDAKKYLSDIPEAGAQLNEGLTSTPAIGNYLGFRLQFSGELAWKEKVDRVSMDVFLRYADLGGEGRMDVFTSLFIGDLDQEYSGFQTRFRRIPSESGFSIYEIETSMMIENRVYLVVGRFNGNSPWHWMLGMDFKELELVLYPKGGADPEIAMEGTLFQSFSSRIKGFWRALAKKSDGASGGMGFKVKMIKKMLYNEV